jgi:hypothetical protein
MQNRNRRYICFFYIIFFPDQIVDPAPTRTEFTFEPPGLGGLNNPIGMGGGGGGGTNSSGTNSRKRKAAIVNLLLDTNSIAIGGGTIPAGTSTAEAKGIGSLGMPSAVSAIFPIINAKRIKCQMNLKFQKCKLRKLPKRKNLMEKMPQKLMINHNWKLNIKSSELVNFQCPLPVQSNSPGIFPYYTKIFYLHPIDH